MSAVTALESAQAIFTDCWGGHVGLLRSGAFSDRSIVIQLPEMVAEAYPAVSPADLDEITVSLCLFSDAIVLADDIMDYGDAGARTGASIPDVLAYVTEAYITFARHFGSSATFWSGLRSLYLEYIDAMSLEKKIRRDASLWPTLTPERYFRLAVSKNNLVRLVDHAVAHLAGTVSSKPIAEALHDHFVGHQMMDDLKDWREDVATGSPSFLLRLACEEHPSRYPVEHVGRMVYGAGSAAEILRVAEERFARGSRAARAAGAFRLADACERRRQHSLRVRAELPSAPIPAKAG